MQILVRWLVRLSLALMASWLLMIVFDLPDTRRVFVLLALALFALVVAACADEIS